VIYRKIADQKNLFLIRVIRENPRRKILPFPARGFDLRLEIDR
jgi:hypothetical protein